MPEELRVGDYVLTVCCDEMSDMLNHHRIALGGTDRLVMLGGVGLIMVKYCWNCGQKIQVRGVNQCQNQHTTQEETAVVWGGREPHPRSGEYLSDFIAKCIGLKPDEDESLITEWATAQYRRFMK